MEKFSNDRISYWNQIKAELLASSNAEEFQFRYLEMGQLFTHAFSVVQYKRNWNQLILKIWNAEYDNKRFDKGIFNLDRLAIIKKEIKLNKQELEHVNDFMLKELKCTNSKNLVLDGLFCQLELKSKKLNWNSNQEVNNNLFEFIEILRHKVHVKQNLKI